MWAKYLQSFKSSFLLKNTYRANSFIYAVKQFPILRKILPDSLYNNRGIKIFANVLSILWEISATFAGKVIYIGAMFFINVFALKNLPTVDLFLHAIVFLTLIGTFFNSDMFSTSNDKKYAMFSLRMNATLYTVSNYAYYMIKVLVGFFPVIFIFGSLMGANIFQCLLVLIFIPCAKMTVDGLSLRQFDKTKKIPLLSFTDWQSYALAAVLLFVAYAVPAIFSFTLPAFVSIGFMLVTVVMGVFNWFYIVKFNQYRQLYQGLFQQVQNVVSQAQTTQSHTQKSISNDGEVTSNRHGFEFFNELFVKRHRKLLWGPAKSITLVSAIIMVISIIATLIIPEAKDFINNFFFRALPFLVFLMYIINRGQQFTQALFMNCDHSMLSYSFYKNPKTILQLFTIRLKEIVKVNLLPAAVLSVGGCFLLFVSGNTHGPLMYFILPAYILSLSVFFSVHFLVLYYLLQPYNAASEMKSATYSVITFLTYFVCYLFVNVDFEFTLLFGLGIIGFCVVYSLVACGIVYALAPKTFKIRN